MGYILLRSPCGFLPHRLKSCATLTVDNTGVAGLARLKLSSERASVSVGLFSLPHTLSLQSARWVRGDAPLTIQSSPTARRRRGTRAALRAALANSGRVFGRFATAQRPSFARTGCGRRYAPPWRTLGACSAALRPPNALRSLVRTKGTGPTAAAAKQRTAVDIRRACETTLRQNPELGSRRPLPSPVCLDAGVGRR